MPLLEDVSENRDLLSGDPLDGVKATFDLRPEILDDNGFEEGRHNQRRMKPET
jgi:hypothetical protein